MLLLKFGVTDVAIHEQIEHIVP